MKNFIGTIGNRTRDLSACSSLPQPTAPPRFPLSVERKVFVPKISKMLIQLFTQMLGERKNSSHIVTKCVECVLSMAVKSAYREAP
jgi:hypothetical protein